MDPLSKFSNKMYGNKRLIENLRYEIKYHKIDGKFVFTKHKMIPPFKCSICEQKCSFHYYGVLSCEACKQFFRRIIIKRSVPNCRKFNKCDILKGDHCQGCRFSKCLIMGMDPSIVCIKSSEELEEFIKKIKELQLKLIAQYYEQIV
ncbi:Nuclear receptor domain-containing protein, partial [Meloidogyne graminicola]